MRFTKKQKAIIKKIASGEIQDLYTYMKSCNLVSFAQYKKSEIESAFDHDAIPKEYYFPKGLSPKLSTIHTKDEYREKLNKSLIRAEEYEKIVLSLGFKDGIKHLSWKNTDYDLNFYDGIHIANSFDDIISFLSIWQYLKSQMLILELPSELTANTLGLFYEKRVVANSSQELDQKEKIKKINFDDFTYNDGNYLNDIDYVFSTEHCTICEEYLDKKIYPSPELRTFIKCNFKTTEEKTQASALCAAWLAIFVAVALPIIPNFQDKDSDYLLELTREVNQINEQLTDIKKQTELYNSEIANQISEVLHQIEELVKPPSSQ